MIKGKNSSISDKILVELNEMKIFDSHEHFGHGGIWDKARPLTLSEVLRDAYIGAALNAKEDPEKLIKILRESGFVGTAALSSIRNAFIELYGIDIYPFKVEKIKELNEKIKEAYKDPDYIFNILYKRGKIQEIINDIQPDYWKDWIREENPKFDYTIRIDDVIFPFSKIKPDIFIPIKSENQIDKYCKIKSMNLESLDDFDIALEAYVNSLSNKARVIKIGSAYQRSINFQLEENEDGKIAEIFNKINKKDQKAKLNNTEAMRWGNYVVTFLMSYATIERMPVQIHTGLATMVETDPRYLIDLMKSFPGVQFDLFHGGYPYFHNVPGILSQINNAFIDLCWMPIISWNATKDLLRECLEWSNQKRIIAFGGDCRSAEGSIGALISMKNLVSEVLAEFVDANRITLEDAIEIGKDVFYDNPKKLFNN